MAAIALLKRQLTYGNTNFAKVFPNEYFCRYRRSHCIDVLFWEKRGFSENIDRVPKKHQLQEKLSFESFKPSNFFALNGG